MFTDGSKTTRGTGAEVFGLGTTYSESIRYTPLIFQEKIHAIVARGKRPKKQSKNFLGNFNPVRSKVYLKLCKNNLRIHTVFLTGHCSLRKLGLEEAVECRLCQEEEETLEQLISKWFAIRRHRKEPSRL